MSMVSCGFLTRQRTVKSAELVIQLLSTNRRKGLVVRTGQRLPDQSSVKALVQGIQCREKANLQHRQGQDITGTDVPLEVASTSRHGGHGQAS